MLYIGIIHENRTRQHIYLLFEIRPYEFNDRPFVMIFVVSSHRPIHNCCWPLTQAIWVNCLESESSMLQGRFARPIHDIKFCTQSLLIYLQRAPEVLKQHFYACRHLHATRSLRCWSYSLLLFASHAQLVTSQSGEKLCANSIVQ